MLGRKDTSAPAVTEQTVASAPFTLPRDKPSAMSWMAVIFIISLIVPVNIPVGTILLMPHRLVLLALFFPSVYLLFTGKAGPIIKADWLIGLSTLWAMIAIMVVHGVTARIEAVGIHVVEFYGAYLLARVSIRSAADFRRVVLSIAAVIFVLLPFAAAEALTGRNHLLEAIPGSIPVVTAPYRWGMRRAHVLFTHPIHYGVFASLGLGLFWYMLRPGLRWVTTPVVLASTVFALSTGGLICFVIQALLIGWEMVLKSVRNRWKIFVGIVGSMYLFLSVASNSGPFILLVRYASFNTGSAYNRILIWRYGTQNVRDNPVFGIGFNEWVRAPWMSTSADNYWLLLAMMFGLPMIIFYVAGLATLWWSIIRARLLDPYDWRARAAYLTATGGIIVGGGTVHYWTAMMAFVIFAFGAGAWIVTGGAQEVDETGPRPDDAPVRKGMIYTRFPKGADSAETEPLRLARERPPKALARPRDD